MTIATPDALAAPEPLTLGRRRRRRPPFVVALSMLIVAIVVACAVLGSAIAPHDPGFQSLADRAQPPGGEHLLGTDNLGRDVLSRVMVGARAAIVGPAICALCVFVLGCLMGILGGYRGGWLDAMFMRFADFVLAVPHLLIVLIVAGIVGGGYPLAVGLLVLFLTPHAARLIRGAVLQQRQLPYVEAARTIGVSPARIMARHIFPNVAPLGIATAFLAFAIGLVALSSLSFLGIGVDPGTADWGRMLVENRLMLSINPWAAVAPALAIVGTAAAMNILGDWVFERLGDDREI